MLEPVMPRRLGFVLTRAAQRSQAARRKANAADAPNEPMKGLRLGERG
jgi:hypothetical protein